MAVWRKSSTFGKKQKSPLREVVALGDSFTDNYLWSEKLDILTVAAVENAGYANYVLSTANNAASIESKFDERVDDALAGWVIIQAGINDISDTADPIANMKVTIEALRVKCVALGVRMDVMNVSPFGNFMAWTSAKETLRNEWNDWLLPWCAANNVIHYDISTALKDDVDATILKAAYDSGDGLHPNAAGAQVMADLVYTQSGTELDSANDFVPY